MNNDKFWHLKFIFVILIFLSGCTVTKSNLFKQELESIKENEDVNNILTIYTSPPKAEVYINDNYIGIAPVSVEDYGPGSYMIKIILKGYHTYNERIYYDGGSQILEVNLKQITGNLDITTEPENCLLILGGEKIEEGLHKLPAGNYNLIIKKFGYLEKRMNITIDEDTTTTLNIILNAAPLEISNVELSRSVFNPENPGTLGEIRLSFYISTYAEGKITIVNQEGTVVYTNDLLSFSDWQQEFFWDGRDKNGSRLPGGKYMIKLTAFNDITDEEYSIYKMITIDTTQNISVRNIWGGISGLFYTATPDVLPRSSFQISSLFLFYYEKTEGKRFFYSPSQCGIRIGLGRKLELTLNSNVILSAVEKIPFAFASGLKFNYYSIDPVSKIVGFSSSFVTKIAYHQNTGSDIFNSFTGISLGNTASLDLGPVSLVFYPELFFSFRKITYDLSYNQDPNFYVWLYTKAGLLIDISILTAGISISGRTKPFNEGFRYASPFHLGVETHFFIPKAQIFISAAFVAEIASSSAEHHFIGGIGIGFLY